eukprot:g832.t1
MMHSKKKKERETDRYASLPKVPVEKLDYKYVDECDDIKELEDIITVLNSRKEGYYPRLVQHTENKLLSVLPEKDRKLYVAMKHGPSHFDREKATCDLDNWLHSINATDNALNSSACDGHREMKREVRSGDIFPNVNDSGTASVKNSVSTVEKDESFQKRRYPPVRGTCCDEDDDDYNNDSAPSKIASKHRESIDNKKRDSKAKPFEQYYREWETFDVDKEMKKIEIVEDSAKEAIKHAEKEQKMRRMRRMAELSQIGMTAEEMDRVSPAEKRVVSENEKRKGNECYKCGDYEEAILYYNRSVAFFPTAITFANRALARLKCKQFDGAVSDCTEAIALEPTYVKAISRRAMALHRQGKYLLAVVDYDRATQLATENTTLKFLLKKSRDKLYEVEGPAGAAAMLTSANMSQHRKKKSTTSAVTERKTFTRLAIAESSSDEEEEEEEEEKEMETEMKTEVRVEKTDVCLPNVSENVGESILTTGKQMIKRRDFQGAVRVLTSAIDGDPRCFEAYILRALAHFDDISNVEGSNTAIRDCSVALVLATAGENAVQDKLRACALMLRAKARNRQMAGAQDDDVASKIAADLSEAQRIESRCESLYANFKRTLCVTYEVENRTVATAIPRNDGVLQKTSKNKQTIEELKKRGNAMYLENRFEDAIACFRECLRRNPNFSAASANLAMTYNRLEKWSLSVDCCRTALSKDPLPAIRLKLLFRCAKALLQVADRKSLEEAVALLNDATRIENNNAKISTMLRQAKDALNDLVLAGAKHIDVSTVEPPALPAPIANKNEKAPSSIDALGTEAMARKRAIELAKRARARVTSSDMRGDGSPSKAGIPRSAYEFRKVWSSLKSRNTSTRASFLLGLTSALRKIFKRSFEADVLEDFLSTLDAASRDFATNLAMASNTLTFLKTCAALKGFRTARMMMDGRASTAAKSIFATLSKSGLDSDAVRAVGALYCA